MSWDQLPVGALLYALLTTGLITSCSAATGPAIDELTDRPAGTNYATIPPATTTTTTTVPPSETTMPPYGGISPTEQEYTVKSGDSMSKIAERYNLPLQDIIDFNRFGNIGHILHPGDVVRIPPGGTVRYGRTTPPPNAIADLQIGTAATDGAVGAGCTHAIGDGENPSRVAAAYGITVDALQAANPSRDFRAWFLAGATIQIPPGAACP